MNKKVIKGISAAALVSGTVASGAFIAYGLLLNNQQQATNSQSVKQAKPNAPSANLTAPVNKPVAPSVATNQHPVVSEKSFEQMASFTVSPVNPITNAYRLTINNADHAKGEVTFKNGTTTQEFNIGEPIYINVKIIDTKYTIQSVRVHSQTNVANGVGNNNLGVYKHSEESYSFTLPPETLPNGKPNPFYDGKHDISVDVQWTLKQINGWQYDFLNGTDSGNYAYQLTKDTVFDDEANPDLKMVAPEGSNHTIYRIYMNGFNLKIKNMTIPSKVQLMFINNKENTVNNGKTPVVSLDENTKFTEKSVHGAIGRWGSVEFDDGLSTILNLNIYKGWIS